MLPANQKAKGRPEAGGGRPAVFEIENLALPRELTERWAVGWGDAGSVRAGSGAQDCPPR